MALAASTYVLLAIGLTLHGLLAVTVGLSPDEAHYALYGAHLDWSYYDHPPLVGWLQAIFVQAGGSDVLMRVVPMATWLATAGLTVAASRALPLSPRESPRALVEHDNWAVGLLLISPLLNLLGVALVPDSLLMPLVPAAMLATWRLRDPALAVRALRWMPLALTVGLAILAKYTGAFIVLAAAAMLVRFHRQHLVKFTGFWCVCAAAGLSCAPIVGWNMAHHWASITYQAAHVAGGSAWRPVNALRAMVLQLVMYGPLLPIAACVALRKERGHRRSASHAAIADARGLVLAFSLPVCVVAVALAGRGSSLPHWTACGWTALVPLAAAGLPQLRTAWRRGLVIWQTGFLGLLLLAVVLGGFGAEGGAAATSLAGEHPAQNRPNPAADVFGWAAAAARASQLASSHAVASVAVMNWSLASRMAWYARPEPVHVVRDRGDQFTLWFGPLSRAESTILVDWSQMSLALPVGADGFARCTPIERMPVTRAGRQIAHFNFYLCEGWLSPLAPASQSTRATAPLAP
jgi:4-amino-4-deoxy-L-arabinose transferase-like glycosyltransferase